MKKVVRILLAILMVTCLALGISACKSECEKGNHELQLVSTDAATCTAAKVNHYKCAHCDYTEDRTEGNPLGHDFGAWEPCTDNDNQHQRACKRTGCTVTEKADHAYTNGTCVCGKKQGGTVAPHEHVFGNWQAIEGGKHKGTCTVAGCNEEKIENHNPVTVPGTPAKCGVAGKEDGSKCSVCGTVITEGAPIPALEHDYTGAEWQVEGSKHYQVCTREGCGYHKEHVAQMSAWADTDLSLTSHEHHCTVAGCTVAESHDAAWGSFQMTDTQHYRQCTKCDIQTDIGNHNESKLERINGEQHSVSCSVCGKFIRNDAHGWWIDGSKSEAATCSKDGKNVYGCSCGAEKIEPVTNRPEHTIVWDKTATKHSSHCTVCKNTIVAETDHDEFVYYNNDKDEHWQWCKTCGYEVPDTREGHTWGEEGFTCTKCHRTAEGVIVLTYYKEKYTNFNTLVEAVASITDNSEAIIYLGKDLQGAGIFIPENRNIIFRLQGKTYTVTSGAVGSKNFESQAFHIEKNSTVTIQNGTITSESGSGVKMLVQNYATLSLVNGIVLDGRNLDKDYDAKGNALPSYTLSNNFGTTVIRNATILVADEEKDVAFDVWYGMHAAYDGGVRVELREGNTIKGIIEYGAASRVTDANWTDKAALVMLTDRNRSIVFSSSNVTCDKANIKLKQADGTFASYLKHSVSEDWTCKDGRHFHECTRCHAHFDDAECDKQTIKGSAATCTANGLTDGVQCSVCKTWFVKQEVIVSEGHKEEVIPKVDATCTEDGTTEGKKCSVCGEILVAPTKIPAKGHTEAAAYIEGNATQHNIVCSVCKTVMRTENHNVVKGACVCGYLHTDNFDTTDIATVLKNVSSNNNYFVIGKISRFPDSKVSGYKRSAYIIDHTGKEIYAYQIRKNNGGYYEDYEFKNAHKVGDVIVLWGTATTYDSNPQLSNGWYIELNGEASTTKEAITLANIKGIPTTVSEDFDLPVIEGLTWTSSSSAIAIANNKATVTFTSEEQKVTLTAKLGEATRDFALTIIAKEEGKGNLVLDFTKLKDTIAGDKTTNLNKEVTFTAGGVTFGLYSGCGSTAGGGCIIMYGADNGQARLYNTTAIPGTITSIKITYNTGSISTSVTYYVTFGGSVLSGNISSGGTANGTIKAGESSTYTNSNGGSFFNISVTNTKNLQIVSLEIAYEICNHETTTDVAAKDADCLNPATIAHKVCTACGTKLDSEGKVLESIVAEGSTALGHTYNKETGVGFHAKADATCSTKGYTQDCYYCTRCEKYFDADGNELVTTDVEIAINPDAHNYTYTAITEGENKGKHQGICSYDESKNHVIIADHTAADATKYVTSEEDKGHHWQVCKDCEAIFNYEEHTLSDTPCDKCGAQAGVKSFSISAEVKGGTYAGAIADVITVAQSGKVGTAVDFEINIPAGHTLKSVELNITGVTITPEVDGNCALGSFTLTDELLGSASSVTITVTLEEAKAAEITVTGS